MELVASFQGAAGLRVTETCLTFADKHPEVSLVGRVHLYAPPQICAETLSVQFSLGGKQYSQLDPTRIQQNNTELCYDSQSSSTPEGSLWLFISIIMIVGGASDIPEAGCKSATLHPLDMECVQAKLRPRLAERGQTCGRRNPD